MGSEVRCSLQVLSKHQGKIEINTNSMVWWYRNFRRFVDLIAVSQQALKV